MPITTRTPAQDAVLHRRIQQVMDTLVDDTTTTLDEFKVLAVLRDRAWLASNAKPVAEPVLADTFSITYRHRDGSISRQTQTGDDLASVIAQHGPEGATVVSVSMRCRATREATGARCGRYSTAGEYCHQHAGHLGTLPGPLTPFHNGSI